MSEWEIREARVMAGLVATSPRMQPTNGVVLIDFTAAWCGPCRAMKPVLAALEKEYAGRVQFAQVDVDHDPVTAQRYDVRSMPTYIVLRDGREAGRIVGSRPRAFVAGVIDRVLDGDSAVASP